MHGRAAPARRRLDVAARCVDVRDAAGGDHRRAGGARPTPCAAQIFNVLHSNHQIRELAMDVAGSLRMLGQGGGARSRCPPRRIEPHLRPLQRQAREARGLHGGATRCSTASQHMLAHLPLDDPSALSDPRYYNLRWLQLLEEDLGGRRRPVGLALRGRPDALRDRRGPRDPSGGREGGAAGACGLNAPEARASPCTRRIRAFSDWCARRVGVAAEPVPVRGVSGWDVKPGVLLHHLAAGEPEVAWFDADLLWHARPAGAGARGAERRRSWARRRCRSASTAAGSHRAVAWGLEPGRELATTVNTAFVQSQPRSTPSCSAPGRSCWPARSTRRRSGGPGTSGRCTSWATRRCSPPCSARPASASVPLHLLRQGVEIAQCSGPAGYSPGARVRRALARQAPPLIHAMGRKPWEAAALPGARGAYERLHAAQSPYTLAARRYAAELDEPAPWLGRRRARGPAALSLAEYPLAVFDTAVRRARGLLGIARFART